jgi:hypothetical protein
MSFAIHWWILNRKQAGSTTLKLNSTLQPYPTALTTTWLYNSSFSANCWANVRKSAAASWSPVERSKVSAMDNKA